MTASTAPTCGIALKDIGSTVELVDLGQGYKDFAPCVSNFIEAAVSGKVRHGGHPVFTAAVMGAAVVQDAAGNLKVDKGKSEGSAVCRIDPAVAAIMAVGGPRPEPARTFQLFYSAADERPAHQIPQAQVCRPENLSHRCLGLLGAGWDGASASV